VAYRQLALGLLVLAFSAARAPAYSKPSSRAAPWLIIVDSPDGKRVLLHDWNENLKLMFGIEGRVSSVDERRLRPRPSYSVAMFWGRDFFVDTSAASLARYRPEQANQHARYFPPHRNAPALWVFDVSPGYGTFAVSERFRSITPEGMAVLERHGLGQRVH
jgi:hypothetical protein